MEKIHKLLAILICLAIVLTIPISCTKDKSALSDEELKALKELIDQKDKEAEQLKEELEKAKEKTSHGTSAQTDAQTETSDTAISKDDEQQSGLIAFSSKKTVDGKRQVSIAKADGTGRINISNNDRDESDPVWSPDGSKLLVRSEKDGKTETFLLNRDGTERVNLSDKKRYDESGEGEKDKDKKTGDDKDSTDTSAAEDTVLKTDEFGHKWSPDGTKILFYLREARDDDQYQWNWQLYVMNADGAGRIKLSEGAHFAYWFPDGSKILFSAYKDIQKVTDENWFKSQHQFYNINADGSGKTNISNNNYDEDFYYISPVDKTKILFCTDIGKRNSQIFIMNIDGAGRLNLSNNEYHEHSPSWSSDGTKILFVSDDRDKRQIHVINADGTGRINLSNNDYDEFQPTLSPDGSRIVFMSNLGKKSSAEGKFYYQVIVMNADGTGRINLSNNDYDEGFPYWSPDGTKIVFHSDLGQKDKLQVHVVNADGTGRLNLSNNDYYETFDGFFSPDGTKTVVASTTDPYYFSDSNMYMISIDSGLKTTLAGDEIVDNISFSPVQKGKGQDSSLLQKK